MKRLLPRAVLWIWQAPQNLAGFAISRLCRFEREERGVEVYARMNFFNSGVSLGKYVVLQRNLFAIEENVKHELGHSRQSLYLGPLYLLAVGLPSLARNIWDRAFHKGWGYAKRKDWYYSGYPENWADRLGGVKR